MRVQVISCCYERPEQSAILRESCAKFGLPLKFCEAPQLHGQWSSNFMISKVYAAYVGLGQLSDYSGLAVWADGFDSFAMADADRIEARWREAGAPPILLSAEKNCFPDPGRAPLYDQKFATDSKFRYVNAGTWMGEVSFLLEFLPKFMANNVGGVDDQRAWTSAYLADQSRNIFLDVDRKVFQNAWGTEPGEYSDECCIFHISGGVWRNSQDRRYIDAWERVKARQ